MRSEDADYLEIRSIAHTLEIDDSAANIIYNNNFKYAVRIKDTFDYSINSNLINISNTKFRTFYKKLLLSTKYSIDSSDENLNSLRIENQGSYVVVSHNYGKKEFNRSGKLKETWLQLPVEQCLFDAN